MEKDQLLQQARREPLNYERISGERERVEGLPRLNVFSWGSQLLPGGSQWAPRQGEVLSRFLQAPMGQSPGELRTLRWLAQVKDSPAAPKDMTNVEERLSYATYLQRTAPKAREILERLRKAEAMAFDLSTIEEELGDYWGEVTASYSSGATRVSDPFFFNQVKALVSKSMDTFLIDLDLSLCRLKGMEQHQETSTVYQNVCKVRSVLHGVVVKAMLSRDQVDLPAAITALFKPLIAPVIEEAKQRISASISGVIALQRVANAMSGSSKDIRSIFETCYHDVQTVALNPPKELVTSLRDRRVSMNEFCACFADDANAASRTPAMSMATRIDMLGDWIFHRCHDVIDACNEALGNLRRAADQPAASQEWSGVQLCEEEDSKVQAALLQPSRFHVLEACPTPSHGPVYNPPPVLVASRPDGCHGLRVVRFFHAVLEMSLQKLLLTYTVRADKLAPIFSRVSQELPSKYSDIVSTTLQPVGEQVGAPFPISEKAAGKRPAIGSPAMSQQSDHGDLELPPLQPIEVPEEAPHRVAVIKEQPACAVPPSLVMAHSILTAISQLLERRIRGHPNSGYVFRLKEIREEAMHLCLPARQPPSVHAMSQHASSAVRRLVDLFEDSVAPDKKKWVAYQKACHSSHDNQTNGLLVQPQGMQPLFHLVQDLLRRMTTNDVSIVGEWHSRGNVARHSKRWAPAH